MLSEAELELVNDLAKYSNDPLKAVLYGFPWNEGDLEGSPGPRVWQAEVLNYIGEHMQNPVTHYQPCRIAIASGHDIGKSSLLSMISWWALSTFEDTRIN